MSVNKTTLMGHLGNDPEIRYLPTSGDPTATLSLATSDRWTDKSTGELKERVQWHRVVIFGKAAEVAQKYLKKGSPVYIEGRLNYRRYMDKEGIERYSTEIRCTDLQLVGTKPPGDKAGAGAGAGAAGAPADDSGAGSAYYPDLPPFDDDVPF